MAQFFLERLPWCPTGRAEDEKVFEVMVEDDSPLGAEDKTPRTTTIVRMFTRGDVEALCGQTREILLTDKSGAEREIVGAFTVGTQHIDVPVAGPMLEWYAPNPKRPRVRFVGKGVRIHSQKDGAVPVAGQLLSEHLIARDTRGR